MEKTIYLIRGDKLENYLDFKNRMFNLLNIVTVKYKLKSVKVVLTEEKPPLISIIPFQKSKIASISIVSSTSNLIEELCEQKGFTGSYKATEALPVFYTKNWKDETRTPGICLLTLFHQKTTIDYNTFINRWHNSHTPLSLKIHPLTHYNRNVVLNNTKTNSENWDGVVEEHTKNRSDLLNPCKFFGGTIKMIPNMIAVYVDTKSFLDYNTIETYLAQEYFIKS